MKVFEEGYEKDYIIEERKNIHVLTPVNGKDPILFEIRLDHIKKSGFVGGKPMTLLTMRGVIKFNHRKRTEGGKMITFALMEMWN